jgi:hypothetical protein
VHSMDSLTGHPLTSPGRQAFAGVAKLQSAALSCTYPSPLRLFVASSLRLFVVSLSLSLFVWGPIPTRKHPLPIFVPVLAQMARIPHCVALTRVAEEARKDPRNPYGASSRASAYSVLVCSLLIPSSRLAG